MEASYDYGYNTSPSGSRMLPVFEGQGYNGETSDEAIKQDEEVNEEGHEEEELTARLLIPNHLVGSIIGKGGATIKEVSQQTGAKIHIGQNEDQSTERVVTIIGSLVCVLAAQVMVSSKMQEDVLTELQELNIPVDNENRITLVPLKLLVSNIIIGRVIGKSGTNIRKIMLESNTHITCSREDEMNRFRGERTVVVIGSIQNQKKAFEIILEQLQQFESQNLTQKDVRPMGQFDSFGMGGGMRSPQRIDTYQHNPHNNFPGYSRNFAINNIPLSIRSPPRIPFRPNDLIDSPIFQREETVYVHVPNTIIGAIIGRNGSTVKEISQSSGASVRVMRDEEVAVNAPNRIVTLAGSFGSLIKAQVIIYTKMLESNQNGMDPFLRIDIKIARDVVGKIIGKKGNQIKQLTEKSGSKVTVQEIEDDENGSSLVTVVGKFENSAIAQHLIQEILFQHYSQDMD